MSGGAGIASSALAGIGVGFFSCLLSSADKQRPSSAENRASASTSASLRLRRQLNGGKHTDRSRIRCVLGAIGTFSQSSQRAACSSVQQRAAACSSVQQRAAACSSERRASAGSTIFGILSLVGLNYGPVIWQRTLTGPNPCVILKILNVLNFILASGPPAASMRWPSSWLYEQGLPCLRTHSSARRPKGTRRVT